MVWREKEQRGWGRTVTPFGPSAKLFFLSHTLQALIPFYLVILFYFFSCQCYTGQGTKQSKKEMARDGRWHKLATFFPIERRHMVTLPYSL